MRSWQVLLAVGITIQLQVHVLAIWPLWGGAPHLIALGAVPFALLGGLTNSLLWVLVGASLFDLLVPARFGVTLVPLLAVYIAMRLLGRHVVNTPTWWSLGALALVSVAVSEFGLVLLTGDWGQYGRDLRAALCLALPMAVAAGQVVTTRHANLRIR